MVGEHLKAADNPQNGRVRVLHVVFVAALQHPDVGLDGADLGRGEFAPARDRAGRNRQNRRLAHIEFNPLQRLLQPEVLGGREFHHFEGKLAPSGQRSRLPGEILLVGETAVLDRRSAGQRQRRLKAGGEPDRDRLVQRARDERAHRVFPALQPGPAEDVVHDPEALPDPGDVYDGRAAAAGDHAVGAERNRGVHRHRGVEHVFGLELQVLQC